MVITSHSLSCVIVEDEKLSADFLVLMLKEYCPEVNILDICNNIKLAEISIQKNRPNIVFLDMNLGGECGFSLIDSLKHIDFKIIITSGEDSYGVQAFKYNVADYLLKPYDKNGLVTAVGKVISALKNDFKHLNLVSNLEDGRFGIPTTDGLVFVYLKEIIRIEAWGSYCNLYLENHIKVNVTKSLGFIEDLLDNNLFLRIHNSHIVNINRIKKYVKDDGGKLVMVDNSEVPISRRRKDLLFARLNII